jgi:GTPase SAR1 family protein
MKLRSTYRIFSIGSIDLFIIGDRNCGKTTLIAKLQGIDVSETGKGIALDYSFLDIHTTAEEDGRLY